MTIISFPSIPYFDQLPLNEAEDLLYHQLIPICESKGVLLSSYGNHRGLGSLLKTEVYDKEKAEHKLFNVGRIQKAFSGLPGIVTDSRTYKTGSYTLKHRVERHQGEYLTNGDLIAAMLLRGYKAQFSKKGEAPDVNCMFKV